MRLGKNKDYLTSFRSLPQAHLPGLSDTWLHMPAPQTYMPLRKMAVTALS